MVGRGPACRHCHVQERAIGIEQHVVLQRLVRASGRVVIAPAPAPAGSPARLVYWVPRRRGRFARPGFGGNHELLVLLRVPLEAGSRGGVRIIRLPGVRQGHVRRAGLPAVGREGDEEVVVIVVVLFGPAPVGRRVDPRGIVVVGGLGTGPRRARLVRIPPARRAPGHARARARARAIVGAAEKCAAEPRVRRSEGPGRVPQGRAGLCKHRGD
mmetsp:Transcript_7750/g.29081  ORF Transcript_7750/g.29081 Transcript_7750/m.29081 type:complete len:213 (-) Transcript_7750:102-740(-)